MDKGKGFKNLKTKEDEINPEENMYLRKNTFVFILFVVKGFQSINRTSYKQMGNFI